MKTGKVSENIIFRSIIKNKDKGAADNLSCALFTGYVCDSNDARTGSHALIRAINRSYESGYKPVSAAVTITIPENIREKRVREIMEGIYSTARENEITVNTGHSEVIPGIRDVAVSVVVTGQPFFDGSMSKEDANMSKRAFPGQAVVMTKWIGIYGSVWIAINRGNDVRSRYPDFLVKDAEDLERFLSVRKEAAIAYSHGDRCMYACSDGGIYAALWKLADRSDSGINAELKAIPVKQETVELCEFYDINPYRLRSDGALLIATDDPDGLMSRLAEEDIPSSVIGYMTDGRDRIVTNGDEKRFLEEPAQDELCKILW